MKVTIKIENPENLSEKQIRHLIMDALAEFQSARLYNAQEYVNRRYPNTPDYAWLDREAKIEITKKRLITAELLRNNVEVSLD